MNFLGNGYYKLNRCLLLLVGLWPYERSIFRYCQMVLCNIIIMFTTFCQIAKLIKSKRNIDLVAKLLSPIIICVIYIIKYQTFCIVAGKIRYLMEHVEKDWNMLKDKRELEIIERYTYIGNMCTLTFTIIAFMGVLIFAFVPFVPIILDIFIPLNVSRPRQLLFPGEYFVDQQKYFYAIWLHLDITSVVVLATLVGTESLYVTYVQHACGMFQVASYRMDQAFDDRFLQACITEKKPVIVCKRMIEAIYIHERALEFSGFLWSTLAVSYSILLMIGVISLIINLFCLFQAIIFLREMNEIIRVVVFIFGHVFYLFLGNYVGQILIDHSTSMFDKIYITQWYGAPLQAQKLLPIIMQRSMRSCKMVMGGTFVPSFQGFAALINTTMSYFTVLWSVGK